MAPVPVLVVDDHPVVRYGLVSMLQTDRRISVVGSAGDGEEALLKVEALSPRVVLMDIHMPIMDGLAATKLLKERFPSTSVLILTLYHNEQYVVEALRAGAAGYLLKSAPRDEICATIQDLSTGGLVIKTTMLQKTLAGVVTGSTLGGDSELYRPAWPGESGCEKLTNREIEVLHLLVEGLSNKEIARHLAISEDTVKKHVQQVILKMHVSDRTHAAVTAIRWGMV